MNAFSRPTARFGHTPEPETPYQRAGQAWDERLGTARVQAKNWRLMAFGSLALAACLAAAVVRQGQRGSVVPWIVQVDRSGAAQAVGPASAALRYGQALAAWNCGFEGARDGMYSVTTAEFREQINLLYQGGAPGDYPDAPARALGGSFVNCPACTRQEISSEVRH